MNAELVIALESAVKILETCEGKPVNETVRYEIVTAKVHVQRAIAWEKGPGTELKETRP